MTDQFNTIIATPNMPDEVGVLLPPADLRRIDFSALDFETSRRMQIEYIRAYYPEDFNDFVLSNGTIMFIELVSAQANILSERSDIIADEAFLPTSQSETAVSQHLQLINQELKRATPATVALECSLSSPTAYDITIPPGLVFNIPGPDGSDVSFELFKTPDDYVGSLIIPKNKRGIIGHAVEGKFGSDLTEISNGEINQYIDILAKNVLDDPIIVTTSTKNITKTWKRIDFLERANPTDEVYQIKHYDTFTRIMFGDNVTGKAPTNGQEINIRYRLGGGIRGRIGRFAINETRPISNERFATVQVIFKNNNPSIGGYDKESLDSAKKRAPREFATHNNIATADDYTFIASKFKHPAYGAVSKAVATVKSGIETGDPSTGTTNLDMIVENIRSATSEEEAKQYLLGNYVNRNIIEMYLLAEGDDLPIAPDKGLKESLKTSLSQINVMSDELRIYDGKLLPINIEAVVVINRNADAGAVKEQVLYAIKQLFDISNRNMGQGFNISDITYATMGVDGVKSISIYNPVDDFPPLKRVVTTEERNNNIQGIGINELVVLGNQNIQFYLEQGNYNV